MADRLLPPLYQLAAFRLHCDSCNISGCDGKKSCLPISCVCSTVDSCVVSVPVLSHISHCAFTSLRSATAACTLRRTATTLHLLRGAHTTATPPVLAATARALRRYCGQAPIRAHIPHLPYRACDGWPCLLPHTPPPQRPYPGMTYRRLAFLPSTYTYTTCVQTRGDQMNSGSYSWRTTAVKRRLTMVG